VVGDVAFRTWPAGAAFGLVHVGSSDEPGQLAFVERWLDRAMAQAVGLERGSPVWPLPDEEAVLAMTRGFDLLVSAKQFEILGLSTRDDLQIFPVGSSAEVAALTVARSAPGPEPARASTMPDEPPSDPSATIDLAALAKLPAPEASADERGADEFKVLNVTVGMTEAEVLAAIAGEFASDQISIDPKSGALVAEKGPCNDADPVDPAIASSAGAFCLELQLTDGAVSSVTLRQVVLGDVSKRALAAFRERYGEPAFENQSEPSPSVRRLVIGWGRSVGNSVLASAGLDPDTPGTVLEGHVWWSNGVTVAVLRLDDGRTTEGSDSFASGQQIKF
jgi:hypothetical protein